jgi:TonB family protein
MPRDLAFAGCIVATALAARPARATAPPDTSVRVPGTVLRFGTTKAEVERKVRVALPAAGAGHAGDPRTYALHFFGLDGTANLTFEGGVLTGASITIDSPTPYDVDYVEDQIARLGYRRSCAARDGLDRRCEWTGRTHISLITSAQNIVAAIEPLPPPAGTAPAHALPAPALSAFAPAETLRFGATGPDSLPAPVRLDSCRAERPAIARENGVFGRVLVDALVDTAGRVAATRIARGSPMLDSTALACARRYRYAPYRHRGRPSPFWITIVVRFTL